MERIIDNVGEHKVRIVIQYTSADNEVTGSFWVAKQTEAFKPQRTDYVDFMTRSGQSSDGNWPQQLVWALDSPNITLPAEAAMWLQTVTKSQARLAVSNKWLDFIRRLIAEINTHLPGTTSLDRYATAEELFEDLFSREVFPVVDGKLA